MIIMINMIFNHGNHRNHKGITVQKKGDMKDIFKKAVAAGSFFLMTLPGTALCADPAVSLQVSVNGIHIGDCRVFVSTTPQNAEGPPTIPAPADGDVLITQGFDYKLIINCTKRESLDDAIRILQGVTGAR